MDSEKAVPEYDPGIRDRDWVYPAVVWARKIHIFLLQGNFNACQDLIHQAETEWKQVRTPKRQLSRAEMLDSPLAQLPMSTRTLNELDRAGIIFVKDLLRWTRADLMEIPNVGETTVREILASLEWIGITSKEDVEQC